VGNSPPFFPSERHLVGKCLPFFPSERHPGGYKPPFYHPPERHPGGYKPLFMPPRGVLGVVKLPFMPPRGVLEVGYTPLYASQRGSGGGYTPLYASQRGSWSGDIPRYMPPRGCWRGYSLIYASQRGPWVGISPYMPPCVPWVGIHPCIYASRDTLVGVPPVCTCRPWSVLYGAHAGTRALMCSSGREVNRARPPSEKGVKEAKREVSDRFMRFKRVLRPVSAPFVPLTVCAPQGPEPPSRWEEEIPRFVGLFPVLKGFLGRFLLVLYGFDRFWSPVLNWIPLYSPGVEQKVAKLSESGVLHFLVTRIDLSVFWHSLCNTPFCSGFPCLSGPFPGRKEVYSRGYLPPVYPGVLTFLIFNSWNAFVGAGFSPFTTLTGDRPRGGEKSTQQWNGCR